MTNRCDTCGINPCDPDYAEYCIECYKNMQLDADRKEAEEMAPNEYGD